MAVKGIHVTEPLRLVMILSLSLFLSLSFSLSRPFFLSLSLSLPLSLCPLLFLLWTKKKLETMLCVSLTCVIDVCACSDGLMEQLSWVCELSWVRELPWVRELSWVLPWVCELPLGV